MKKLSLIAIACLLLGISACNDDENETPAEYTVDDAKQAMSDMSSSMTVDIVELTQSEGVDAIGDLVSLMNLSDPFGGRMMSDEQSKKWIKKHAQLFKGIFVPKSVGFARTLEGGFDFESNWGEYNWDPANEEFVKSSASPEMIIINFPAEGSSTNNITLRLVDFEEQLIEDDIDQYYLPSSIEADLSVDGTEQISIDFSAQYNNVGMPVAGAVTLFLNPYTFSVSFDDTASKSSKADVSVSKGDDVIVAVDATANYTSSDKEELEIISGFVQYRNLKISGQVDFNGMMSDENPDPNDHVSLSLLDGEDKVGDIIFITEMTDNGEEDVPYLEYSDGSTEKLEDILAPVIEEIEDFGDEVESWGE